MEPTATPSPSVNKPVTPVMDVIAPPKSPAASGAVVEAPRETEDAEPTQFAQKPVAPAAAQAKKPAAVATAPKPAGASKPVWAIGLALLFFIILSGLAYYAYAKNQ